MLDRQVYLYGLDTSSVYSNHEKYLHDLNMNVRQERNYCKNALEQVVKDLAEFGYSDKDIKNLAKENGKTEIRAGSEELIAKLIKLNWLIVHKRQKAHESKDKLTTLLSNKVEANISSGGRHHIREVRPDALHDNDIIATFDSSLTRTIGCEINAVTTEICSMTVFYFDVFKDVLYHGFYWNGEKYIYYTSSAGQLRTKRSLWCKESTWARVQMNVMCGLTVDHINELGGCNVNKYLAYTALANSATDVWEDFDIDRSIVIEDFEMDVNGEVDYIDMNDWTMTRQTMDINNPVTDGAGMMLPSVSKKNFMVRMPWMKGLLCVFDFYKFIEMNNYSSVIKDIYGTEHDVIAEGINVIFTKSQFKMWKYYDSWEQYKEFFKQYNCTAGFCNLEEDYIKNSKINYQMLQTLFPTDEEILKMTEKSAKKIQNMSKSLENVREILGLNRHDDELTPFQKAVNIYPSLMNDTYTKEMLRDMKNSLLKKYRSGKIEVAGKYTFIVPDLYGACQFWFGDVKKPRGILNRGEVFCDLYKNADELDCLRAPHIYYEHGIRHNVASEDTRGKAAREWFTTNALYVASDDLLSKVLMFDVDGDRSLVVADKTLIEVAKRSMEGHPPLYYDMKKAAPMLLNNDNLFRGIILAFTTNAIGPTANSASKQWNSDEALYGDREQVRKNVAYLTAYENASIDYAKTLWKPEFPPEIKAQIGEISNRKLPAFFEFAKDMEEKQIQPRNKSFVNRIYDVVPDKKISLVWMKKEFGKLNYRNFLDVEDKRRKIEVPIEVIEVYNNMSTRYRFKINLVDNFINNGDYINREIRKEFSELGYTDKEVVNFLVTYLYKGNSKNKNVLWFCYGEELLSNLKKNLGYEEGRIRTVQCMECGEYFDVPFTNKSSKMCPVCYKEYRRKYKNNFQKRTKYE